MTRNSDKANQDARNELDTFGQFRLRYRELAGCRPPRAPTCVSACAALVSEFGEERVFAALQKWVSMHEQAEDLVEDTHRPGDFLLEDAREMLRTPAPHGEPRTAPPAIPHVSLIDLGPGQSHATAGHLSAAVFAQPEAAVGFSAEQGTARAAPASLAISNGTEAERFPLFAREMQNLARKK